jgi:hypothetical protein
MTNPTRNGVNVDDATRDAAGGDGHGRSDDLTTLAGLHDRGVLNDDEFRQAKAKILN